MLSVTLVYIYPFSIRMFILNLYISPVANVHFIAMPMSRCCKCQFYKPCSCHPACKEIFFENHVAVLFPTDTQSRRLLTGVVCDFLTNKVLSVKILGFGELVVVCVWWEGPK